MATRGDDKFELPISRQDLLPGGKRDRTLFVLMLFMVPTVFVFDTFIVLPMTSDLVFLHRLLGVYILVNITGNMLNLLWSQPSARDLQPGVLPPVLMPNWFYCHECQLNVPPRSYHCRVCDACILKQDHHCMFAGKCVAFGNQRFFVVGVFYIFVGAIYSLVVHFDYSVTYFMGGYRKGLIFGQLAPHLGWLFGYFDIYGCVVAMLNIFELCVAAFCGTLLYSQVACIVNNQTMHERKHDVTKFKHPTLIENLEEVLGEHFLKVWFWPFVTSKPKGDGINFIDYEEVENRKSL